MYLWENSVPSQYKQVCAIHFLEILLLFLFY